MIIEIRKNYIISQSQIYHMQLLWLKQVFNLNIDTCEPAFGLVQLFARTDYLHLTRSFECLNLALKALK